MKLVIEVTALDSGKKDNGGQEVIWTRLRGRNSSGSYCRAIAFGALAARLDKEVSAHLPKGESVGSSRIVVDMTGEWRDDKEFERNGEKVKLRSFHIATFDILTGPVLELARLRRDGGDRLALAEEHRKEGRLDLAYKTVAEFAAQVCNRSLDLSDIEEEALAAADEAEFGAAVDDVPDPEAAAAARYAAMDSPAEPMEIAQDQPAEIVQEREAEPDDRPESEAGQEQEADVLEDGEPEPSVQTAPPARSPAPARPVPPRGAPPAARPAAPAQRPAPSAAPASAVGAQAARKSDLPRAPFRAPPPRPKMPGM